LEPARGAGLVGPGEAEARDVGLVDPGERAVALLGVGAAVDEPLAAVGVRGVELRVVRTGPRGRALPRAGCGALRRPARAAGERGGGERGSERERAGPAPHRVTKRAISPASGGSTTQLP